MVQKNSKEVKKGEQQASKACFLFFIRYNCGEKEQTMKRCMASSRVLSKKIERNAVTMDNGKKKVKIINIERFTKGVNSKRTPSPTQGPALKTTVLEQRICYVSSITLHILP